MKAMYAAFAATIVISVGAWAALGQMGFSVEDTQSSSNVRLD